MTECIKNYQTKNHFIKRSIENNLSRNGWTVWSNDTLQMFHIAINKILKDLQSSGVVL